MVYKVLGLMSGSSLDGLDIAHVQLDEVRGVWSYKILHAECLPYDDKLAHGLKHAGELRMGDFLKLHTRYGKYLGDSINKFIAKYELSHEVHFIASHGHTVFHEPQYHTTCQIGDGAAIAAITGLPVISDLRAMDVALGGQGAPIVPIGDKLLFGDYDYLLNIGGIANITVQTNTSGQPQGIAPTGTIAFDVCPANQVLNTLAQREGKAMDDSGSMAALGDLLADVLDDLNDVAYYRKLPPKSLSNEDARDMIFPKLMSSNHSTYDLLHTATCHIAEQVAAAVKQHPHGKGQAMLLATGGGAFNNFLIMQLEQVLAPLNVKVIVPGPEVIKFKEALVMALIGTLRWREEVNALSSVTGAGRDSAGGALWLG